MTEATENFSLTIHRKELKANEKFALSLTGIGLLCLLIATFGAGSVVPIVFLLTGIGLTIVGAITFFIFKSKGEEGFNFHHIWNKSITNRGIIAWILAIVLTGFYVLLYWFPQTLEHLIKITDPISFAIRGKAADQWFAYATFYTIAVLLMGIKGIIKYRHNNYQILKILSVSFVQLFIAFLIPYILEAFNKPTFFFSYFWPLDYDQLFPNSIHYLNNYDQLGPFLIWWAFIIALVLVPIFTYLWGKRWYCSWVCGCGGLAETAGDDFRHLSDNSLKAWKIERWMVHSVLLLIVSVTLALWIDWRFDIWDDTISNNLNKWYGFFIGAIFAGVIGVGFYPMMGPRVWCRYGCPQAAILGLFQRYFSRFRITTNGGQCISCGNCSTFCHMGIDVKWYAQRGQNIVRASCVGCGICSEVCPRGVLNLEHGPKENRAAIHINRDEVRIIN